jgi:hypothetical protein
MFTPSSAPSKVRYIGDVDSPMVGAMAVATTCLLLPALMVGAARELAGAAPRHAVELS